jgi:hypothetical protein
VDKLDQFLNEGAGLVPALVNMHNIFALQEIQSSVIRAGPTC